MITILSLALVTITGFIVTTLSLWGMVWPGRLIRMVQIVMQRSSGIYIAVFVRFLLGAALIICAEVSGYPTTFMILGWLTVIAAIGLALMGRQRMSHFVAWFDRFPPLLVRLWLVLGAGFGVFLVQGALSGAY